MSLKPINPPQEAKVKVKIQEGTKRGRKRKNKRYFTNITELAINAYNRLGDDDQHLKNKIYNRFIHYPFYKLVEIVYNTGRYDYIDLPVEDIKHEIIAHMIDRMFMYKADLGRAFSYFNRMAKNELIQRNIKAYEKVKLSTEITAMDSSRNVLAEETMKDILSDQEEFLDLFCDYVDTNLGMLFNNRRDIAIADSFIVIFRHRHLIENYNKKAIYLLVRERSRCEQHYVTKIVNILKALYEDMFKHFQKTGKVENPNANKISTKNMFFG